MTLSGKTTEKSQYPACLKGSFRLCSIPALKPSNDTLNPATRTFGMFAYLFQTWRGDKGGSNQADGECQAKRSKRVFISGIRRTTNAGKDRGSGGKIRIQTVDAEGVRPDTYSRNMGSRIFCNGCDPTHRLRLKRPAPSLGERRGWLPLKSSTRLRRARGSLALAASFPGATITSDRPCATSQ